ncbi:hypothetical protein DITRI_Ditri19aG0033000 [Diplodiscus trichospermus]
MACTSLPSSALTTLPIFSIQISFFPKTSQPSTFKKKKRCCFVPKKVVPCKATNGSFKNDGDSSLNRFDRRDVLIGLGGFYGATNLANDPFALAAPIDAPNLTRCGKATIKGEETVNCCPPSDAKVIDFKPPKFCKLRYRPAAHMVDADYIAKFTKAMQYMKALPDSDPRSFSQQAKVHCAYCNGAYDQVGFPDQNIQVHFSWLFFPFHRLYLYFFERILGKLIDDPDFAMPFWNWDAPEGMTIPSIYTNPISPLFDEKRNVNHQPPKLVDLDYDGTDDESTKRDQIRSNLKVMYRQMVCNKTSCLFFGRKYSAGDKPNPGVGAIENIPHTSIHRWCGDKRQPHGEDMGNFYSAGRDPLFYAHHSNVDRMWSIWKTLPGKMRKDFTDPDWLNASFLFYDENANLVRAKVSDCLDTKSLGYDYYQCVDIPWLRTKPFPKRFTMGAGEKKAVQASAPQDIKFPIVLDQKVSIKVARPKTSRSTIEKENEEEILLIEKIQLDRDVAAKFDVYINSEDDKEPTPEDSEFAGCFTNLPHNHKDKDDNKFETSLSLALTDLLEELRVEGDENIVVTLVPKGGKGLVTVGGIKIDYC